jgi:hypothetical protein
MKQCRLTERLTIRLSKRLAERLKKAALDLEQDESAYVRELLRGQLLRAGGGGGGGGDDAQRSE